MTTTETSVTDKYDWTGAIEYLESVLDEWALEVALESARLLDDLIMKGKDDD